MAEWKFPIGGLANTVDKSQVPDGMIWRMQNGSTIQDILDGGGRYGDVWARSTADPQDEGFGLFYAEYGGTSEYLAVVKHDGDTTARLYKVHPDTGVFTAIVRNDSDALHASDWYFGQFEDKVYALNATDGLWVRRIGGKVGAPGDAGYDADDDWKEWKPEFARGSYVEVETEKPPYDPFEYPGGTTVVGVQENGAQFTVNVTSPPDANNRIKLRPSGEPKISWTQQVAVVIELPAGQDFSAVDHVGVWFQSDGANGPEDILTESTRIKFMVSEDASTPITYDWVNSLPAAKTVKVTEGTVDFEWWLYADISNIADADKTTVRRIVIQVEFMWSWDFVCFIKEIRLGGKYLLEGFAQESGIEYAFAYFNATTGSLSPAVQVELPSGLADGQTSSLFLDRLGAWVRILPSVDSGLHAAGYEKIKIFRKERVQSGVARQWHYLGMVDNDTSPDDPEWRDTLLESELLLQPTAELRFEPFEANLEPQAIGICKQHVLLGLKRRVFFSFAGRPGIFLPPPEDNTPLPDEDPITIGRTLYMSEGRTEEVMGFCAQDILYLFGPRSVYAMIGDFASEMTPPRLLPGARGVAGRRAFARWQTGVVVAAKDGLWFYQVSRAFTGSVDANMEEVNLTEGVMTSWADLFSTDGSGITVAAYDDSLWVFGNGRYMRLTREFAGERAWEEGLWPDVAAVAPVNNRGLRFQLGNGTIARADIDASGVKYSTDNGTPVSWWFESGESLRSRRTIKKILCQAEGAPVVELVMDDGAGGSRTKVYTIQDRFYQKALDQLPGLIVSVKVSGVTGTDKVKNLILIDEEFENRSN